MQQSLINDEYLIIVVFSDENEINISQRDTCILRFSSFIIHYSLKGSVAGNFATLPNLFPSVFSPGGQAAADVPFLAVFVQYRPHLPV